jgi:hypothetical protein
MRSNRRRDFLSATVAGAAAALFGVRTHAAEELKFPPEREAKLRVLRWKRFVQGDEDQWIANTRRFTQASNRRRRRPPAPSGAHGAITGARAG